MRIPIPRSKPAIAGVAIAMLQTACAFSQNGVAATVDATHPIAYYRLDATSGKSVVGATTYKPVGGVTAGTPGPPTGGSRFAQLNGHDGYILTTQLGGVGEASSIMAWVDLADLPSKVNHFFYVAGESQNGNDLDLQFETDNQLKFFTASGGHLSYAPPPATLLNRWHMIVATLDTRSHTRAIYWDGKRVASDQGGGQAGKNSAFSIGASTVFGGRYFSGGVAEAALWNRALTAAEVAGIYAAASPAADAAPAGVDVAGATPATGPFATTAKIEVEDAKGPVHLKREEQIAYMFLSAIEIIEHNCQLTLQHVCTLNQMLSGSYPKPGIEHLKFDPNKTDPNYTYTLAANGMAWEAHANPRKPGLAGMCSMSRDIGTTVMTYNPAGNAGWTSTPFGSRGSEGDSFATQ